MLNTRAGLNLLAVSIGTNESKINAFEDCDQSLLVSDGDYFNLDVRREDNSDEANGKEEPDVIYDNGATASTTFNFNKLQPNQAAFMLAFGLGDCVTTAAGSGFLHTITPIDGDVDEARSNPSFTAVQRIAKTIAKRRFASCFIDSLTMTFAADDWVKGNCKVKTTGFREESVEPELVTAADNATSIILGKAVQGATAEERLDNVQAVYAPVGGGNVFATVNTVSADPLAVLTIEPLGGAGADVEYTVLYAPTEKPWGTFPARVTESPMRVAQMCLYLGGSWNGTQFVGGKKVAAALKSFEYTLNNNMSLEFTPCAGGDNAGRAFRQGRDQTIKLTRKMRDMLLQHWMGANTYFGLYVLCEGKEYEPGHKYTQELIFPRLGVLSAPLSTDGKLVAEAGDLRVLEDALYGSVIARTKNLVGSYAQ